VPWVEANGASLRYALSGRGSETLVLIHEAGGCVESWDAVTTLLAQRYRVLRYDQRGFGLSERARVLDIVTMVEDLFALLNAVLEPGARVHLIGTAIGGTIAVSMAAQHPECVASVTATSPVTGLLPAAAAALEARALLVEREGMRSIADAALSRSYPESLRGSDDRFQRYRARFLGNDPHSFAALSRSYASVDLTQLYGQVRCPALIIGCSHDAIKPAAECAVAAAAIAQGQYVELNSGHFVAVQSPEVLVRQVESFIPMTPSAVPPSVITRADANCIEANGVSLRYALSGHGQRVLVLVHEMGGNIEGWDDVVPMLEAEFRVLRYDQRGFGLSEKASTLSLADMTEDLRALVQALAIDEPVYLAGAALGASICLSYALAHPAAVAGLLLSSPATGGSAPEGRARMESWLQQVAATGVRAITDAMFAVTYPDALRENRQRFDQHRLRWLSADPESFIALNHMMMGFNLLPDLHRIGAPTRVVGCRYDSIRTPARSQQIAALMPAASYAEVESGHYLPIQSPALFVAELRKAFAT
jgi:3-oxoadipate enol-lactonase